MRVFFAIDLPEATKNALAGIMDELQTFYHEDSLRWVDPQRLHVTLGFLENILEEDVDRLVAETQKCLKGFGSFELHLGELELFPSKNKPRLISITLTPHDIIADLAKCVVSGIKVVGYETDKRPFRGHVTLGRFDYRVDKAELFLPDIVLPVLDKIWVNEIVLFQSRPLKYEALRFCRLD